MADRVMRALRPLLIEELGSFRECVLDERLLHRFNCLGRTRAGAPDILAENQKPA